MPIFIGYGRVKSNQTIDFSSVQNVKYCIDTNISFWARCRSAAVQCLRNIEMDRRKKKQIFTSNDRLNPLRVLCIECGMCLEFVVVFLYTTFLRHIKMWKKTGIGVVLCCCMHNEYLNIWFWFSFWFCIALPIAYHQTTSKWFTNKIAGEPKIHYKANYEINVVHVFYIQIEKWRNTTLDLNRVLDDDLEFQWWSSTMLSE